MTERPIMEQDWHEVPRAEMLKWVFVAVDCAHSDAEAHGDERYMRYCDEVLFPFLETEKKAAIAYVVSENDS
jgi:hypothetical protein